MKTQSAIIPPGAYAIEKLEGDKCEIVFYANVKEIEHDEEILYEYDLYRVKGVYRENLAENIESNYDAWITAAIIAEEEEKLNPTLTSEEKIDNLQKGHVYQEISIDTCLEANVELFEMLLGLMPMTLTINESKSEKGGNNSMVEVYVTLIVKGKKTIDEVPAIIRPQVEAMLKELGV